MTRLAVLLAALAAPALAQDVPCPPADRPVADHAHVLSASAVERIARVSRDLQEQKGTPLVVVTIPSMALHGGAGWDIETFALRLLAQWQFDNVESDGRNWEKGILVLVAVKDRKCRIGLGTKWGSSANARCVDILDEWILPRFRKGDHEGGVEVGVTALDGMVRGTKPRAAPKQASSYLWPVALVLLGVFTVVSLVRRGTQGAAWSFWRSVFSVLGVVLMVLASSRGRRSYGWGRHGGFGMGGIGGGFGGIRIGGSSRSSGGFSGGGSSRGGGRGATGSW
jgi:uncharacterized protein